MIKQVVVFGATIAVILFAVVLSMLSAPAVGEQEMPFGGEEDVAFADMLWKSMGGYEKWPMKSDVYPGKSPHGELLQLYYNLVNISGKPYHIIVKDNFGGEDATLEAVSQSPREHLGAVTVMLQREPGYDVDNSNWFWAKYKPDGAIDKNAKGVALAGRVAKGMDAGCIACHSNAKDSDYLFTNDTVAMSLDPAELLQEKCTTCHNLDRVKRTRKDKAGWDKIVDRMIRNGAKISEAERQELSEYLAE
jgi:hypothetical protein